MEFITLKDGYNGHTVECECEPIEKDGDTYKLRVKNSYMIKWCSRQEWESAMWEAYTAEIESGINDEYANYEAEMYREQARREKYEQWRQEQFE